MLLFVAFGALGCASSSKIERAAQNHEVAAAELEARGDYYHAAEEREAAAKQRAKAERRAYYYY
jgi:hypothetical protein